MDGLQGDKLHYPALIAGISFLFCLVYLNFLPIFCSFILIGMFLLLIFTFWFIFKNNVFLVASVFSFVSCLVFLVKFYQKDTFINSLKGKSSIVTGYVVDLPVYSENRCEYLVQIEDVKGVKFPKFKAEIVSKDDLNLGLFQKFKTKINFFDNNNISNCLRLKSQGISISGSVIFYQPIETLETKKTFRYYILNFKEKIINYIDRVFAPECARLLRALFFRDRSKLTKNEKIWFERAGIFHFLAVSGFHFAIITQILNSFLSLFKINKKASQIICFFFVAFFMSMIGFTPSVVRSGIMIMISCAAKFFSKRDDSINSLSLALLVILFVNPDSCLDIGLWMSFVSSICLILFSSKLKKYLYKKLNLKFNSSKFLDYLITVSSDSIIGTISVFPVISLYFKSISLVFLISNFLISFQIYILMFSFIISFITKETIVVNLISELANSISKLILFLVEKLSHCCINIDYSFIPFSVACLFILIFVSFIFGNLRKDMLKIAFCFFIFLEIGSISYQVKNKNSYKLDVVCSNFSNRIVVSNTKSKIIFSPDESENRDYLNENSSEIVLKQENFFKISAYEKQMQMFYFKLKNKFWAKIRLLNTIILVCFDGGDAKNLPDNLKSCDIFLAFKIPNNFSKINFKDVILADNSFFSRFNCNKISKYKNYVSNFNDISINCTDKNYQIYRKV